MRTGKDRLLSSWIVAVVAMVSAMFDGRVTRADEVPTNDEFRIQGEYEGVLEVDGSKWAAQIIALGDGKFRSVGYQGGLPGNGWTRGAETHSNEGQLKDGVAIFEGENFVGRVDGRRLSVETTNGEVVGRLEKVNRTSPTLGAAAPAGAIVLFDGTNGDEWNNARITDNGELAATGTDTKRKFGDHHLHIEFRTPFVPDARGQGRGNSGVYVQSRYEVQVLDSFGLEGRDNECGGIYSQSAPVVNMCFPPLSWQTYDIDFTAARFDADGNKTQNARITVRHNGVVIHDDLELTAATPGRLPNESAEPAPLFLQDHGNPVLFRNIWVVEN